MSKRKKDDYFLYELFIMVIVAALFIEYIIEHPWLLLIPIVTIIIIFILYYYINKRSKIDLIKKHYTIENLLENYKGNDYGFEKYISNLYEMMGYKTQVTSKTNDGGKDIVMWKDGRKYVVEVKLYARDRKIGRPFIQKLHSAMIDSEANEAIFITTSEYTEPARKYADKFNIKTVDGYELAGLIDNVRRYLE